MPYYNEVALAVANTWTGEQTHSAQLRISDGTVGQPSIVFTSDDDGTGTGIWRSAANAFSIATNGVNRFTVNTTDALLFTNHSGGIAALCNSGILGFSSNGLASGVDVRLEREAAAVLQMGADVNGAAVAQTLKAHDGITGTDVAGANLTVAAGRGTGAGAPGDLIRSTAVALATGTTAQTLNHREYIRGGAKALVAASATTFVSIAVPTLGMVGGVVEYAIQASDGTDHQCRAGILPFAIVNKADAETGTVGTVGAATEVVAVSSGTLTNTFTIVAGSNSMDIKANAASSLSETTLQIVYQVRINPSLAATVITPA